MDFRNLIRQKNLKHRHADKHVDRRRATMHFELRSFVLEVNLNNDNKKKLSDFNHQTAFNIIKNLIKLL